MTVVEGEIDVAPGPPQPPAAGRPRAVGNASYLAAANLGAKLFSLLFILYANRALHKGFVGDYAAVTGFVGLFVVLADLGLGTLAVRDVSADRSLATRYISNLLALRVLLSALSIVAIVALARVYIDADLRVSVYVYAIGLVPLAVSSTLQTVFQFSERLAYGAILNVTTAAATAALGILVLALGQRVLAVVTVYVVVMAATALATAALVYARFLPRRLELDPAWWPALAGAAVPFAALTFINVLYNSADRQILYVMKGCGHMAQCPVVGEYSVAYRPLDILITVFAGSINAAVLPAFMRAGGESRQGLARLARTAGTLAFAVGMPVALFTTFYAREALRLVGGGEYEVAAPALAVLIWAFPCVLLLTLLYNALYAVRRQNVVTAAFAATLLFNVALNVALVPRYSYLASAAITVASEVLNGAVVLWVLRREVGPLRLGVPALRVGAATAAAAVILWLLRPYGVLVGLPAGVVVVLLGLRLARVLGPAELDMLGHVPLMGRYAHLLSPAATGVGDPGRGLHVP